MNQRNFTRTKWLSNYISNDYPLLYSKYNFFITKINIALTMQVFFKFLANCFFSFKNYVIAILLLYKQFQICADAWDIPLNLVGISSVGTNGAVTSWRGQNK